MLVKSLKHGDMYLQETRAHSRIRLRWGFQGCANLQKQLATVVEAASIRSPGLQGTDPGQAVRVTSLSSQHVAPRRAG